MDVFCCCVYFVVCLFLRFSTEEKDSWVVLKPQLQVQQIERWRWERGQGFSVVFASDARNLGPNVWACSNKKHACYFPADTGGDSVHTSYASDLLAKIKQTVKVQYAVLSFSLFASRWLKRCKTPCLLSMGSVFLCLPILSLSLFSVASTIDKSVIVLLPFNNGCTARDGLFTGSLHVMN